MKIQSMWTRTMGAAALIGVSLIGATATAGLGVKVKWTTPPPAHLKLAKDLIDTVTPATNSYGTPAKLTWAGENGKDHSTAVAKCATFVTELMIKAYDIDFQEWFGSTSPHATCYHDTIEVEDGFTLIESIEDVKAGDVVAIRYDDAGCDILSCGQHSGCSSTGHVTLVAAAPTLRTATAPFITGTLQYSLPIFDSTSDAHGVGDSRWQANGNGTHDTGVGSGVMRVYVKASDPDHPIVGYTWTTTSGSTFYSPDDRDMVIGRIELD